MDDSVACFCTSFGCAGRHVSSRTSYRHKKDDEELSFKQRGSLKNHHAESLKGLLSDPLDPRNVPLFQGKSEEVSSTWSQLGFVAAMMKIKASFPGLSRDCFESLLHLIRDVFQGSELNVNIPLKYEECYAMVKDLLPRYETYDACKNGCLLFRQHLANHTVCPKCNEERYDKDGKAILNYHYLPLIPRLQQMYSVEKMAMLLQQHSSSDSTHYHDVWDTNLWQDQYSESGLFNGEKRCLSFGYSTDGVQPYQHLNLPYSIWPQALKIYNLPPELRQRMESLMLVGIVPGPKSPSNMDAFHELLIEEMLQLENGVLVWDAYKKEQFMLKADIMVYTMDWPARCKCFKYKSATSINACPYCRLQGKRLKTLDKTVYVGSSDFLPDSHPMRSGDLVLADKLGHNINITDRTTYQEDLQYGKALAEINKQIKTSKEMKKRGIRQLQSTRKTIEEHCGKTGSEGFVKLSTYKRHGQNSVLIDWMHCAKNMAKDIIELLTGKKDNCKILRQEHELGRFQDYTSINIPGDSNAELSMNNGSRKKRRTEKTKQPQAPFLMTSCEKTMADNRMMNIKVPLQFNYKPRNLFHFAHGMKSIEWIKVFSDGILKYALRGLIAEDQRVALFKFCSVMDELSKSSIVKERVKGLKLDLDAALAGLEKYFPVSLKSLMFHLPHHFTEQIERCGPLSSHSMFVFERFMSFLTKRMTSHRHPEMTSVNNWRIHYFANLVEMCGHSMLTTVNSSQLDEDLTEDDEPSLKDTDPVSSCRTTTDGLTYLKGERPKPQPITLGKYDSMHLYEYYKSTQSKLPYADGRLVKYFAASWQHPASKKTNEYRCKEIEDKVSSPTVSSVVGIVRDGTVFFGGIQFFISHIHKSVEELAYVEWYGEGKQDKETGLWICESDGSFPVNPFCHPLTISKPLAHAWDGGLLWILNFNLT